jgi:hypothetical protein
MIGQRSDLADTAEERTMERTTESPTTEMQEFRRGILDWAEGYVIRRRAQPSRHLGLEAAQADLRGWSNSYFEAREEAAALAAIVSACPGPGFHIRARTSRGRIWS